MRQMSEYAFLLFRKPRKLQAGLIKAADRIGQSAWIIAGSLTGRKSCFG